MFDPKKESDKLHNALKNNSNNNKEIVIEISTSYTNSQRLKIREEYKTQFGTDLIEDLKSEFSGHLKEALVSMYYHPIDFDCFSLRSAMKGLGTDEDTLIEIIGTRPNSILKKIIERYSKLIEGRDLISDVKGDTSGSFRKLLVSILQTERSGKLDPDIEKCNKMANELYEAGEKKLGTDDSVFHKIFATSSPLEISYISKAYHKLTGHTILQAISNEFSGDIKKLLIAVVYAVISPSEFFATKVNKAIKGITNDKLLIRILVSRCEIDIKYIKLFYKQLYKKDMIEDIKGNTSGDYQKLLVKLANWNISSNGKK